MLHEKDEIKWKGKGDTVGKVVNHFQYEKWQKSSFLQERPDTDHIWYTLRKQKFLYEI